MRLRDTFLFQRQCFIKSSLVGQKLDDDLHYFVKKVNWQVARTSQVKDEKLVMGLRVCSSCAGGTGHLYSLCSALLW